MRAIDLMIASMELYAMFSWIARDITMHRYPMRFQLHEGIESVS
jgi:hypothetical protein